MIAELLPGQAMNQIVLVNSFERRQKKNGEEYLKLVVKDISGLIYTLAGLTQYNKSGNNIGALANILNLAK